MLGILRTASSLMVADCTQAQHRAIGLIYSSIRSPVTMSRSDEPTAASQVQLERAPK